MSEYSNKAILVYDLGSYTALACKLAESYGKVFYWIPGAEMSLPTWDAVMVGKGVPGLERIDHYQDCLSEISMAVFPDILSAPVQEDFLNRGIKVFGSRRGDELELYRPIAKKHMKSIGLNIGSYAVVKGMNSLRSYLKEHNGCWVKTSRHRGTMESFCSPGYDQVEVKLDDLEHSLGAKKHTIEFCVEDAIPDCVELGWDCYSIDGQFPNAGMWGIENKGTSYLGRFTTYDDTPKQLKEINSALSETLKNYEYRNFMSIETRIDRQGKPWILDPCMRMPEPPGALQLEMYTNLADIIWQGADGKLVNPIPKAPVGAELIIQSDFAAKNWTPITFPSSISENVKLRFQTILNGVSYCVPQPVPCSSIGAVVGWGNTFDSAIEVVTKAAEKLKGYGIACQPDSLQSVKKDFNRLKDYGITA